MRQCERCSAMFEPEKPSHPWCPPCHSRRGDTPELTQEYWVHYRRVGARVRYGVKSPRKATKAMLLSHRENFTIPYLRPVTLPPEVGRYWNDLIESDVFVEMLDMILASRGSKCASCKTKERKGKHTFVVKPILDLKDYPELFFCPANYAPFCKACAVDGDKTLRVSLSSAVITKALNKLKEALKEIRT